MANASLVAALNDALPQTQCTRCGYADCHALCRRHRERRRADQPVSAGRCGGHRAARRVDGQASPASQPGERDRRAAPARDRSTRPGASAARCACRLAPSTASSARRSRCTPSFPELCTGCELCLPVCPVDCIGLVAATADRTGWQAGSPEQAAASRQRYAIHRARLSSASDEPLEGRSSVDDGAWPPAEGMRAPARANRFPIGARQSSRLRWRGHGRIGRDDEDCRHRTLLRDVEGGQSRSGQRAGVHERVRTAGGGAAVGAGDRCQRQQGDAEAVPDRQHAGAHRRTRTRTVDRIASGRSGSIATRPGCCSRPANILIEQHGGPGSAYARGARGPARSRPGDGERGPQRRFRRIDAAPSTRMSCGSATAPASHPVQRRSMSR